MQFKLVKKRTKEIVDTVKNKSDRRSKTILPRKKKIRQRNFQQLV